MADVSALEGIKEGSGYLAGAIADELADASDAFAKDTTQVLKFHGIYQQDDRDVRRERMRAGLGKDVVCMVRASIPGGVLTAAQYRVADDLSGAIGSDNLRITTRQGLQWHFVKKWDLTRLIRTLNEHLVTTLAACGDVVRNVMACPAPLPGRDDGALVDHARRIAMLTKPRTQSYWDLWVDGERTLSAVEPEDGEPLYGPTYLPRKFKIGFAYPGDNCVDVYTNDIGIVPHYDGGSLTAFTVMVGGGLGMSHNNPATYPRLADPLATVTADDLETLVTTIIGVQRDHGDRAERKHARMKYLVDDWGLGRFRAEVERRLGRSLPAPRPLGWADTHDHLGWHEQHDGRWFLGVRVESGRIADHDGGPHLRTALRSVVDRFDPGVRFTPQQDVLLTGLHDEDRPAVEAELRRHGVALVGALQPAAPAAPHISPLARRAMACPALPTCGLALTEAERALPDLVTAFEQRLEELGLADEPVHLRVTGCPNGCARPYSTEIGVVGRGKDHYTVYLGGAADGTRLNEQFLDRVALGELVDRLTPVLAAWRDERAPGEQLGAWCDRLGASTLRERFTEVPAPAEVG